MDDEDFFYFQLILRKTDLSIFTDPEKYYKALQQNQEELDRHEELRKENAYIDEEIKQMKD